MSCEKSRYISDYLNKELDPENIIIFEAHFKKCPECSRVIAFVKKMGKLHKYPASNDIADMVMEKIENPGIADVLRFNFERFSKLVIPALALVAIFLILKFNPANNSGLVKISFSLPDHGANSVSLVGDFNNWDASKGQLQKRGRAWHGSFYVKPGRYQYMIVVDEKKWMPDPMAKEYVEDGYGSKNSLIDTKQI
ncbi:MAG: zf-HC2 domain-containing protein [Elusimicrobiota bacterium]